MEEKYGIDAETPTSKTAFKRALEKGVESGELILPNGRHSPRSQTTTLAGEGRKADPLNNACDPRHLWQDQDGLEGSLKEGESSDSVNRKFPAPTRSTIVTWLWPEMFPKL